MLDHPDGIAVYVISNNLPTIIARNSKEPFNRLELVDFNAEYIFLNSIGGGFLSQLSVLPPESVNLLITTTSNDKVLVLVETTQIPVMAEVVLGKFVHIMFA